MHEFVFQLKFGADAFYLVPSAYWLVVAVSVFDKITLFKFNAHLHDMIYILGQITPTLRFQETILPPNLLKK